MFRFYLKLQADPHPSPLPRGEGAKCSVKFFYLSFNPLSSNNALFNFSFSFWTESFIFSFEFS